MPAKYDEAFLVTLPAAGKYLLTPDDSSAATIVADRYIVSNTYPPSTEVDRLDNGLVERIVNLGKLSTNPYGPNEGEPTLTVELRSIYMRNIVGARLSDFSYSKSAFAVIVGLVTATRKWLWKTRVRPALIRRWHRLRGPR